MADPQDPSASTGDGAAAEDEREPTGTPRWVKVFGIIALVLVLLFVIALLTGGHGPDRHTLSAGRDGHASLSVVTEEGVHRP